MRALTGGIITAGALIGLGLASIGLGNRYEGRVGSFLFNQLDRPMELIVVVLVLAAIVGLAITFVGLAYHHERRHHERTSLGTAPKGPTDTFTA